MSDFLFLPSGETLQSFKFRAKKLSKAKGFSRSAALNELSTKDFQTAYNKLSPLIKSCSPEWLGSALVLPIEINNKRYCVVLAKDKLVISFEHKLESKNEDTIKCKDDLKLSDLEPVMSHNRIVGWSISAWKEHEGTAEFTGDTGYLKFAMDGDEMEILGVHNELLLIPACAADLALVNPKSINPILTHGKSESVLNIPLSSEIINVHQGLVEAGQKLSSAQKDIWQEYLFGEIVDDKLGNLPLSAQVAIYREEAMTSLLNQVMYEKCDGVETYSFSTKGAEGDLRVFAMTEQQAISEFLTLVPISSIDPKDITVKKL